MKLFAFFSVLSQGLDLNQDITVATWDDYRLPTYVIPTHYNVELKPYLDPENQVLIDCTNYSD